MKFTSLIYLLSKEYGKDCTYIRKGEPIIDLETGEEKSSDYTFDLPKVIVLPVVIMLSTVRSLRVANHPAGAFYNKYQTFALFDLNEFPDDKKPETNDEVILEGRKYVIGDMLDFHGEFFLQAGLEDLKA